MQLGPCISQLAICYLCITTIIIICAYIPQWLYLSILHIPNSIQYYLKVPTAFQYNLLQLYKYKAKCVHYYNLYNIIINQLCVFTFVIHPFSSLYISTAILATHSYKILITIQPFHKQCNIASYLASYIIIIILRFVGSICSIVICTIIQVIKRSTSYHFTAEQQYSKCHAQIAIAWN